MPSSIPLGLLVRDASPSSIHSGLKDYQTSTFRFPSGSLPVQTLVLLLGGVAAASVVVGRRRARGVERQQIKWLLYAGAIFFLGNVLKNTVFSPLGEVSWGLWVGYLLVGIGGLGGPRHRYSHPALQALRDRYPHKPHSRLRCSIRVVGTCVLRGRSGNFLPQGSG